MQEYDTSLFDALCLCVECGKAGLNGKTSEYKALCDWLLNLSLNLIRPRLPSSQPSSSEKNPNLVSLQEDDDPCPLRPEERFPYFTKRVCRARIWGDYRGELFKRLQGKAVDYMADIAELCNAR